MAAQPTAQQAKAERSRLAALPITDHFRELIEKHATDAGEETTPLATVDLHVGDGNGLGLRVKRWVFEQFNEEQVVPLLMPGRNVLVLRFAGVQAYIAQRIIVGPEIDQGARIEPTTTDELAAVPAPPPTMTPTDSVGLMMTMMGAMNTQNQAAAARQQATSDMLMARLLDRQDDKSGTSELETLLKLDKLLSDRASSRDTSEGGELAKAAAPLLSALTEGMTKGKAESVQPQPAASSPAKQLPPVAEPTRPELLDAALRQVADMLVAGGTHPQGQPDVYAAVVLDYIEAAGFDPTTDVLDKAPAGGVAAFLCAKYPQLSEPFVGRVEASMRLAVEPEADDDEPTAVDSPQQELTTSEEPTTDGP